MESKANWMGALLGGAVTLLLFGSDPAKADITSFDIGFNIENNQTGPSTVSPYGTFFSVYAYIPATGDYTSGTLTYPGSGSPQALSPGSFAGPNVFYQTPYLANQAALDAAYPFGTYTIQASGGTDPLQPSSSVGIDYTANAYGNTPALTAGSYDALQSLHPALSDTVDFNTFMPNVDTNESFIFLNVYLVSTGADVFSDNFLPSSTTDVVIPGGTLAANTAYSYELIFDDRILGTDINGSGIATQQEFDTRTFGDFTTGSATVPEPSSLALGLIVLGFVAHRLRRRYVCES